MESVWVFKLGLRFLMKSISNTKQSNLFWHCLKTVNWLMELPVNNKVPFIGIEIVKNRIKLETQVYRKPTNTGLLLHYQSQPDKRYKDSLLKTMIHRAYALSSIKEAFNSECAKLRPIFSRLDYPVSLMVLRSTISFFVILQRTKQKETMAIVAQ